MRSEYRFPRLGILLMLVVFISVIAAIEKARNISAGDLSSDNSWMIVGVLVMAVGLTLVAGSIGYAILRLLGLSGVYRISNIQTGPRQRGVR